MAREFCTADRRCSHAASCPPLQAELGEGRGEVRSGVRQWGRKLSSDACPPQSLCMERELRGAERSCSHGASCPPLQAELGEGRGEVRSGSVSPAGSCPATLVPLKACAWRENSARLTAAVLMAPHVPLSKRSLERVGVRSGPVPVGGGGSCPATLVPLKACAWREN